MRLNYRQTEKFLFTIQCFGGVFVGIFLVAYLAGLPSTNVLHSEPFLRISLAVIGTIFLALTITAIGIATISEKE